MPHYMFNIRNGDQLETTLEAIELADLDAVRQEALASGRETVAELLRSGASLNSALSRSFEVTDETGTVVLTLPLVTASGTQLPSWSSLRPIRGSCRPSQDPDRHRRVQAFHKHTGGRFFFASALGM
jgi:Domain of unknown function (DUF6894)